MPHPASLLATDQIPARPAEPHLVPLAGEWAPWRDLPVRTAGFPVSGLDIFGSPGEQAGLRAVARDPMFRTAVTGQNRAAMRSAVGKIAARVPAAGSAQRRREEVVAAAGSGTVPRTTRSASSGHWPGDEHLTTARPFRRAAAVWSAKAPRISRPGPSGPSPTPDFKARRPNPPTACARRLPDDSGPAGRPATGQPSAHRAVA